jgi:hypothetical protein
MMQTAGGGVQPTAGRAGAADHAGLMAAAWTAGEAAGAAAEVLWTAAAGHQLHPAWRCGAGPAAAGAAAETSAPAPASSTTHNQCTLCCAVACQVCRPIIIC